jgi:hypothetical protein
MRAVAGREIGPCKDVRTMKYNEMAAKKRKNLRPFFEGVGRGGFNFPLTNAPTLPASWRV